MREQLDNIIFNFRSSNWHDWLDIAIIAVVVYLLIGLVLRTRAGQLAKGFAMILGIYIFASALRLRTVSWLLDSVLQVGIMAPPQRPHPAH